MGKSRPFTYYDGLKFLALVAMTLDHVATYLMPEQLWLRAIGRIAAPVFCFLVGWNGQYRFRRSLLAAAAIMSGFDMLYDRLFPLNILWSILLGRAVLQYLSRREKQDYALALLLALVIWMLPSMLIFDYGALAFLWMLWGQQQRQQPRRTSYWLYLTVVVVTSIAAVLVLFPFTPPQAALAVVVTLATLMALHRFTPRELPYRVPVVLFLSRHALAYYVLHRAMLMMAALGLRLWGA